MKFNQWLDTFIEEKGIDLEETFNITDPQGIEHNMPYGVVVEHIKIATHQDKIKIKDVIVQIDFKNGDVKHFFRHLAEAIVSTFPGNY